MDARHHHHSLHSCKHSHGHNSHHGEQTSRPGTSGFERYGGFPQLSRIFPPISSSSSTTSSTDSNIRVRRKFKFHRKMCACALLAILFIGIGAAVGIYLGLQFLSMPSPMEQLFRGSFTVTQGDSFTESLSQPLSQAFKERAGAYKKIINELYSQSLLKNAFLTSEILAFDGVEGGSLTVLFNIHVDTHRIRVDAGDLFITLAEAIRSTNGVLEDNIIVDQDSLEIQERSMEFLYLPSTERNYNKIDPIISDENFINPSIVSSSSESSSVSISSTVKKSSPKILHSTTKSPKSTCSPNTIDFCTNNTRTGLQIKNLDRNMIENMRRVVQSNCYPFSAPFLCGWGVECGVEKKIEPCKNYCEEFLTNCGNFLSPELRKEIKCGAEWSGEDSCIPKPGCVEELYKSNQEQRVCDGIMDCIDFSDELHCPYCPPGHFHCGAGRHCISPEKKCDGNKDCPNGSDEKACLTLAPSAYAAGYVHQYFNEGYLFVHDQGKLGKLCVERNESSPESFWKAESQLLLDNIGSSACELLGFRKVAFVRVQPDGEVESVGTKNKSSAIGSYVRIQEPGSSSEVTFTAGSCPSKKVLYVGCNHLECGKRPSHLSTSTQLAGHGDFPWHAILLKNDAHVCDASLITSQWLLTTSACFDSKNKAKWSVHFGRVRKGSISPWQQERRIIGMVKSPLGDSLVLIKMGTPVIFSDFARHVCLPDEGEGLRKTYAGWEGRSRRKCIRLGWNKQDELVETSMHPIGTELCPPLNFINSTRPPLCFENSVPGKECLKEVKIYPGGPIFCQNEETKEWVLEGISSTISHPKCGIEKFRASPVSGSTEWILKTIEALSNNI